MPENQTSPTAQSCIDLKSFMKAQVEQIEKYRVSLEQFLSAGEIEYLDTNTIADQWILLHSAQFRKHWDESVKTSS